MDLSKAPVKQIANAVIKGQCELGEIPLSRRNLVQTKVNQLKVDAEAVKKPKYPPKKQIRKMNQKACWEVINKYNLAVKKNLKLAEMREIIIIELFGESQNAKK